MTRGLLLADGIAAVLAATGLALLVRPAAARAVLRLPDGEEARYALRIVGAMVLAAGAFLAGFANALAIAVAA